MADILIRGMEMPKSCYVCAHHHWSNYWQNYVCCAVWAEGDSILIQGKEVKSTDVLRGGRSEKCPLVEIPPHGRLIDADALKKKHHWTDDFYETEYVEVEDIDAAPTIIPESEEGGC